MGEKTNVYQLVLFSEDIDYRYDEKDLLTAIKQFNKYKTGNKEADAELWQNLLKKVKKYRIDDLETEKKLRRQKYV